MAGWLAGCMMNNEMIGWINNCMDACVDERFGGWMDSLMGVW